jgi:transcriptional regulator with XRE-family HTH domain
MNYGQMIRLYRKKNKITQSQLAEGICSITHLSKIENGSKEVNQETLELLFDKLGINLVDVKNKLYSLENNLDSLNKSIFFYDKLTALDFYEKIDKDQSLYLESELVFKYYNTMLRYYLFVDELEESEKILSLLTGIKSSLDRELYEVYRLNLGIYNLRVGKIEESYTILKECLNYTTLHKTDLSYFIALVAGRLEMFGHSFLYAHQALELFQQTFNTVRSMHTISLISILLIRQEAYQEAKDMLIKIVDNKSFLGSLDIEPMILHNMGIVELNLENYHTALAYFNKYKDVYSAVSYESLLNLWYIALTNEQLGCLDEAIEYYKQVYKLADQLKEKTYYYKGKLKYFALEGNEKKYIQLIENEVLDFFINKDLQEANQLIMYLIKYYKGKGDHEKVNRYIDLFPTEKNVLFT